MYVRILSHKLKKIKTFIPLMTILIMSVAVGMPGADTVSRNEPRITVIKNVNIIPMTRETVLRERVVLLKGKKILDIVPAAKFKAPAGAKVIDGKGGYLMPGLADMHVHMILQWPYSHLAQYIANGVTTIRDLGGAPFMLKWRKEINGGKRLGPNLFVACPTIRGFESNVPQLAETYAKSDYDCMKLYSFFTSQGAFSNAVQTAHAQGVYTVGHIPFKAGLEGVIAAGMKEIAHIEEIAWWVIGWDTTLDLEGAQWLVHLLQRFKKNYPDVPGVPMETFKEKIKEKVEGLVKKIKAADITVCSTLIADENLALKFTDLEKILARPSAPYLPRIFTEAIEDGTDRHLQLLKGNEGIIPYAYEVCKAMMKELKRRGVPIVLGTDAGVSDLAIAPGFSVHRELQLMTVNGFSPYEALVTCTKNAAQVVRAMGKDGNFGTIEKGKRADLVLVKSNPLEDIGDTRGIQGVMAAGKWLPADELRKISKIRGRSRDRE